MASKNSELWHQARRARDALVDRFIGHPAVSLIDIGYDPEPEPGQDPDRVVVRVHVRQPRQELDLDLPPEVEGIAVRVLDGDYQPQPASPPPVPGETQASARGGRRKKVAPRSSKGATGPETGAGPADPGWEGLAEFVVSFGRVSGTGGELLVETRVRHAQSGEARSWQGMALEELARWMSSRAGLPSPGRPAETDVVELSGLWVSQAAAGGQGVLRSEVCFSVVEPTPAVENAGQVPYTIEFRLADAETGEPSSVAVYDGLVRPGEMDCPIEHDLPIPPPGRYRLDLVARLLPPGNGTHRLEGPMIVVEE